MRSATSEPLGQAPAGRGAWVAFLVMAAVALWRIVDRSLLVDLTVLLGDVPDDSVFYNQIAMRFAAGAGFSYDGLHPTYGFQPLWQLLLAACAHAFEDREAFLRFGVFVLGLLHLTSGLLLGRALGRRAGAVALVALGAFWFLNPPLLRWAMAGKENALYLLLLLAMLLRMQHAIERGRGLGFGFGVLGGLLFLSRVNALGFLVLVAVAWAVLGGGALRARLGGLARAAAGTAAVAGPWLAYSYAAFGTLLPTSGVAKLEGTRRFVEQSWHVAWMSPEHALAAARHWPSYFLYLWKCLACPLLWVFTVALALGLAGALLALIGGAGRPAAGRRRELLPLALLSAWAVGNGLVQCAFLPQYLRYATWYAVPEALLFGTAFALACRAAARSPLARYPLLTAALVLAVATAREALDQPVLAAQGYALVAVGVLALGAAWRARSTGTPRFAVAGTLAIGLVLTCVNALPYFHGRYDGAWTHTQETRARLHRLGLWTREHLPVDAVLGAYSSGILSYFSERTVISLEGLASELSYVQARGNAARLAYLQEQGIEYVFGPGQTGTDGGYVFAYYPPDAYTLEWAPFPGFDFYWQQNDTYLLIRPRSAPTPPRLAEQDFPFGEWRPRPTSAPPIRPARRK